MVSNREMTDSIAFGVGALSNCFRRIHTGTHSYSACEYEKLFLIVDSNIKKFDSAEQSEHFMYSEMKNAWANIMDSHGTTLMILPFAKNKAKQRHLLVKLSAEEYSIYDIDR